MRGPLQAGWDNQKAEKSSLCRGIAGLARELSQLPPVDLRGFALYKGLVSRVDQENLVADIRAIVASAPLFTPTTASGRKMRVRMTSAGRFGWISDRSGYRYAQTHPNGQPWPAIPETVVDIWRAVSGSDAAPECCLVNFYDESAKMGMHQDRDEADFSHPVVSISLGDDALFRVGNLQHGGTTQSVWLSSGDVVVMGGDARLRFHGIDRVKHGSSSLLKNAGRINLTLRVVT